MKNLSILFLTAFACCLFSCRTLAPEEAAPCGNVLSATFEAMPASRTNLSAAGSNVYKVLWTKDDRISVFPDDQENSCLYYLTEGEGTTKGTFAGYGAGSRYIAYYPGEGELTRIGDSGLAINFPEEQVYASGTFADNVCPMVASGTGGQLTFRNLASILKISLTGRQSITKVVFRPNDKSIKVSGPASVSVADPANPVLTVGPDGTDSLYINAGYVNLTEENATDFYLLVPPRTYKGGFTVRICTASGYMDKVYKSDFTFERSRVHEATPVKVKLTNGVDASENLEGLGTPSQPFKIASLSDLLLVQATVNQPGGNIKAKSGGSVPASSASYLLTADVDLSPACSKASGISWNPIGSDVLPFTGNFDGGGHKISNLYINAPEITFQGFFGNTEGEISNLKLDGVIENAGDICGLLTAYNYGVIRNCETSGSVYAHGKLVGGTAGICNKIYACSNHADVRVPFYKRWIGGIAGEAQEIYDCFNDGALRGDYTVGGICSTCYGIISGCTNQGIIDARGKGCGGIVGHAEGPVVNCINNGRVQAGETGGGIAGEFIGPVMANCYNSGVLFVRSKTGGGLVGWLGDINNGICVCEIKNCVTTGDYTTYDVIYNYSYNPGKEIGALCGATIGKKRGKDYLGNDFMDCTVEYSYWLYDKDAGLGIEIPIATEEGTSSNIFLLNQARMKGADTGQALYKTQTKVVDALNAWVADNPVLPGSDIKLKEWKYDGTSGYPTLK